MGIEILILTYTDENSYERYHQNLEVFAISRKLSVPLRYFKMVRKIQKLKRENYYFIANGCFVEIGIASVLTKIRYVAKVPGDIVWERARNKEFTRLDVDDFQKESLTLNLKAFRYLFHISLKNAAVVITPSNQLFNFCLSWGVEKSKLQLIYNSIEIPPEIQRTNIVREYDFVTVCRLVSWKGVDQVINSVGNAGSRILIIGSGPEEDQLKEISKSFPGQIDFAGQVAPELVGSYLRKAKFFVLNSQYEATSYAMLEAMSQGLIPIGNEGTGSEEIIMHLQNGILCGGKSGYNIDLAVKLAMSGTLDISQMSDQAVMTVRDKFDKDKNYSLIYGTIVSDR